MPKFHVWIAKGPWAASDDFDGPTKEEAKERAAAVYKDVSKDDLSAHPASECQSRGCNG